MTLKLMVTREVAPKEIYTLVYGTGMLTWDWWGRAAFSNDGVAIESEDDMTEKTVLHIHGTDPKTDKRVAYKLTMQEIVNAAGTLLAAGYGGEDARDMASYDLGYADANMADNVLQQAIWAEIVYG